MRTADFDYSLPSRLIAQTPMEPRDRSRLMVLHRDTGSIEHRRFYEIVNLLQKGDVLVLNDSRVIPARLWGRKVDTGGKAQLLLLRRLSPGVWEALARPGKRLGPGTRLEMGGDGSVLAEVLERTASGTTLVRFEGEEALEKMGEVPLPPYIKTPLKEPERYQTVYAKVKGSVAAPTAGLHFTPELLDRLREKGARLVFVTLHVGLDSFRPVQVEDPKDHPMHKEWCEMGAEAAEELNKAKKEGRRIVCVGTTSVRALEEVAGQQKPGESLFRPFSGWTSLFILPGHEFRAVDAMLTNFHLPRSTLLMLVCAFAGKELIERAYQEAIREGYRFYSFGDGMVTI